MKGGKCEPGKDQKIHGLEHTCADYIWHGKGVCKSEFLNHWPEKYEQSCRIIGTKAYGQPCPLLNAPGEWIHRWEWIFCEPRSLENPRHHMLGERAGQCFSLWQVGVFVTAAYPNLCWLIGSAASWDKMGKGRCCLVHKQIQRMVKTKDCRKEQRNKSYGAFHSSVSDSVSPVTHSCISLRCFCNVSVMYSS